MRWTARINQQAATAQHAAAEPRRASRAQELIAAEQVDGREDSFERNLRAALALSLGEEPPSDAGATLSHVPGHYLQILRVASGVAQDSASWRSLALQTDYDIVFGFVLHVTCPDSGVPDLLPELIHLRRPSQAPRCRCVRARAVPVSLGGAVAGGA